ncbi:MAG TPA: hypothetical protein VMO17_05340 [Terriglobia bacterium]|nr:hypothetical protein [Terriglobia bacterium]
MYRVDRDGAIVKVINTSNAKVVFRTTLDSEVAVEGRRVKISEMKSDEELLHALTRSGKIK